MPRLAAYAVCGLLALPGLATTTTEIRGRVATGDGLAIEQARVASGDTVVYTDSQGRFELACPLPCTVEVSHARFTEQVLSFTEPPARGEITVSLASKQAIYEEILVTASRGTGEAFVPESMSSTVVHLDQQLGNPSTVLEAVESVPGLSENGQGGIFQTFSIRGISGPRVMTLVEGMPIVSERRAGVSASFVDPALLNGVEVMRGPASTFWGSGALGGVLQVFPRAFDKPRATMGYDSFGDETYQSFGLGLGSWSLAFAHRERNDDEAPDGTPLNENFEQYSASIARRWQHGDKTYELLAIPTLGRDVGKSSSLYPDSQLVDYPQEEHLLLRFAVAADAGWSAFAWAHPNSLRTETLRPGRSVNVVENEAFDMGANVQRELSWSKRLSGRVGLDWFGRRGVEARETEEDFRRGVTFDSFTLDGEQDELAAYGALRWSWGSASLQAGSRFTWHEERQAGTSGRNDTAITGFVGLVQPLGHGFELKANAGTGLRFPSLSERFFSGTTGRGTVIGSPDLEAEESVNLDLGLAWYGERAYVSAVVFRQSIDEFIERVDVSPGVRTFENLTAGEIVGLELESFVQLDPSWRISLSGHLMDGEEHGTGRSLADVPPHRVETGLDFTRGRWHANLALQHRFSKDDPAATEKPMAAVDLVSAAIELEVRPGWKLALRARNLLDETYFNAADVDAPLSPGRSLGLGLVWEP